MNARIIPLGMTFEQALRAGYAGRIDHEGYRKWLKTLPCDVCGRRAPSDPKPRKRVQGRGHEEPDLLRDPRVPFVPRKIRGGRRPGHRGAARARGHLSLASHFRGEAQVGEPVKPGCGAADDCCGYPEACARTETRAKTGLPPLFNVFSMIAQDRDEEWNQQWRQLMQAVELELTAAGYTLPKAGGDYCAAAPQPSLKEALEAGGKITDISVRSAARFAPEQGSMDDFAEMAALVAKVARAPNNGEALGHIASFRRKLREQVAAELLVPSSAPVATPPEGDPLELAKYVLHYYGWQPSGETMVQWLYKLAHDVRRLHEPSVAPAEGVAASELMAMVDRYGFLRQEKRMDEAREKWIEIVAGLAFLHSATRFAISKDVMEKAIEFKDRADDAGFLARAIIRADMDAPVEVKKGRTRPAKAVRSPDRKANDV